MIRPKVFISHSAKTEDVGCYLRSVRDALEAGGCTVRLDQDGLDVGDGWRRKLFQWMDEVHGAVLLLSESALTSKFVPIELSVLSFRHVREQNFPLLPVLVGDLDITDLEHGTIGNLRLTDMQCLVAEDPQRTAEKVVACLRQRFEHMVRLRTPIEILENEVVSKLRRAGFDEEQLREAAYCTPGFETATCADTEEFLLEFARTLLRVEFPTACDILRALGDRTTLVMARHYLLELLNLITPFCADEESAAALARCALAETNRRNVTLACMEPWTAHTYICRSSCKPLGGGWKVCELTLPVCEDELASILDQLARSLTPVSGAARRIRVEDVDRRLRMMEEKREPLFVLFPPEWIPSVPLLLRLREKLPTLTIFAIGSIDSLEPLRPYAEPLTSLGDEWEIKICDTYDITKIRLEPSMNARAEGRVWL